MSDIAPLLNALERRGEWLELLSMIAGGEAPQALAAIVPGDVALNFRDMYARRVLCSSGSGDDGCDSCGSWTSDGHPDLVVAGRWGEPPGISDCLDFQVRLYLKPVVAPGRLGVVSAAEGLSLPAANSLLKITEEPPARGRILFVAERDEFITTIRSRVWMFRLLEPDRPAGQGSPPVSPPRAPAEWASWLERTKKFSIEELAVEAEGWARDFCARGDWRVAASLQNALFLARKRHL
ncbi:MAG: DNA polymerase III subunit delta', partial [Synergistaceae bacterium]|nr:DNA polymerase III subunit delta' [Synergistaceae bacterium]